MKQKLLKTLVLLFALIVGSATSWADTAEFDFTKMSANSAGKQSFTSDPVTLSCGSGAVSLESSTMQFRWYSSRSLTISVSSGYSITGISITKGANDKGSISLASTSSGTLSGKTGAGNGNVATWSGNATSVKFSSSGQSRVTNITVTYTSTGGGGSNPVAVTGVSLDETELALTVGSNATLTATVAPANASNKNVSWESSNTDVATVDNGEVTAIAAGTATITVTTEEGNHTATCYVTVREAKDYATLPFNWEGGVKDDFTSLEGVTASGLGKDYAVDNAPYRVKFDDTDDYIQIKTDSQIGNISIGVKMIGGANASSIVVKESTDGETFTDVETLSISGSKNDILSLETTNSFAAASRYVRLSFTKGSNVGVGPISIEKGITIGSAGFATLFTPAALDFSGVTGLTAYTAAKVGDVVHLTPVSNVQANTGVVLEGAAKTYSIPAIATSTTARGELTGSATAATTPESGYTYYVLASTGSGVEFRPVSEGVIAAGKAFLKVAGGSPVHAFNVVFGDETGISETMRNGDDEKMSAIFDLSGRRVAKPAKGLYIVNGKKILVK